MRWLPPWLSGLREATRRVLGEARAIRDGGGFGSIVGRNTFQRDKAAALQLLDGMMRIYKGEER